VIAPRAPARGPARGRVEAARLNERHSLLAQSLQPPASTSGQPRPNPRQPFIAGVEECPARARSAAGKTFCTGLRSTRPLGRMPKALGVSGSGKEVEQLAVETRSSLRCARCRCTGTTPNQCRPARRGAGFCSTVGIGMKSTVVDRELAGSGRRSRCGSRPRRGPPGC